jgi:hypothetical protein
MGRRKRILGSEVKQILPDGSLYLKEGVSYSKPNSDMSEDDEGVHLNEYVKLQEKLSDMDPDFDFSIRF